MPQRKLIYYSTSATEYWDELKYDELNVSSGLSLKDALYEAGLITEETYGAMFVENIDGHIADTLNDGVTWLPCYTEGKQIMGSFDKITVEDGQTMYLKYYVVPDMD